MRAPLPAARARRHLLGAWGERDPVARGRLAGADDPFDLRSDSIDVELEAREHAGGNTVLLEQQPEQEVLGADVVVLEPSCLVLCEDDRLPSAFGEAAEETRAALRAATRSRRRGALGEGACSIESGVASSNGCTDSGSTLSANPSDTTTLRRSTPQSRRTHAEVPERCMSTPSRTSAGVISVARSRRVSLRLVSSARLACGMKGIWPEDTASLAEPGRAPRQPPAASSSESPPAASASGGSGPLFAQDPEQQVLRPDPGVTETSGLVLGEHHHLPSSIREPLEHTATLAPETHPGRSASWARGERLSVT